MGCLFLLLVSPLAGAWAGLVIAGDLGSVVARCLRGADDLTSFRDRILGLVGMVSPASVLVAMVYGVDAVPLGGLALACLVAFIAGFRLLYRRMKLDYSP